MEEDLNVGGGLGNMEDEHPNTQWHGRSREEEEDKRLREEEEVGGRRRGPWKM